LRQDNAKENVALIKIAKGKDWMLAFEVKFTARKTPQQKAKAEMVFTVIKARQEVCSLQHNFQICKDSNFDLKL
jgi:hypothetical protein